MSYCRFSDESDVYVYAHVDGFIACDGCRLVSDGRGNFDAVDQAGMIAHLLEHREAGHKVPEWVIEDLKLGSGDSQHFLRSILERASGKQPA